MAPSPPPPQLNSSSSINHDNYFIIAGMALIVVIVVLVHAISVGYCAWLERVFSRQQPPSRPPFSANGELQSWIPAYEYRKEMKEEADMECAVCLSVIAEGEMVRELLQCRHTFHVACIDLWFGSHASCPLCRSIVLPTPSESTEMAVTWVGRG